MQLDPHLRQHRRLHIVGKRQSSAWYSFLKAEDIEKVPENDIFCVKEMRKVRCVGHEYIEKSLQIDLFINFDYSIFKSIFGVYDVKQTFEVDIIVKKLGQGRCRHTHLPRQKTIHF